MKDGGRLRISGIWNGAIVAGLALALSGAPAPAPYTGAQPARIDATWRPSLQAMDVALERGDTSGATAAWFLAYGEAYRARAWEAFVEVGEASLKTAGDANAAPRARRLFRDALFRARDARSLDGVLMATHAFAQLGDRDVVAQGLRMARQLAGADAAALERVRALEETPAVSMLLLPRPA